VYLRSEIKNPGEGLKPWQGSEAAPRCCCAQRTTAINFDRNTSTLVAEAPSRPVANQLNSYFAVTVRREVAGMGVTLQGVAATMVEFVPRRQQPWSPAEGDHLLP
jgi:hypothetical protein